MTRRRARTVDRHLAVAYLRVSKDDQNLSPEAQRSAIATWAAANGVTVACYHEDHGVSSGVRLSRRAGLSAALDAVSDLNAGILLVARRDRLARDVIMAAMVEQLLSRIGARLASAAGEGNSEDDDQSALLLRRISDVFAEHERAIIRRRTRNALAVKRQRGERVGSLPIGSKLASDGVHLDTDTQEAAALARIRALRASGASLRAIAQTLNNEGVPARGSRWHLTTVARVLSRAA
jgi:DNA invertase Pin-like site-specific DNA recombinase